MHYLQGNTGGFEAHYILIDGDGDGEAITNMGWR